MSRSGVVIEEMAGFLKVIAGCVADRLWLSAFFLCLIYPYIFFLSLFARLFTYRFREKPSPFVYTMQ